MDQADKAERVQLWRLRADEWLSWQTRGREIVADDLIRAIGLPDVGVYRNNSVGAWFGAQAKAGRLHFAGRTRKSKRVIGHGNPQRVWIVT
jgi:hypothetical protein